MKFDKQNDPLMQVYEMYMDEEELSSINDSDNQEVDIERKNTSKRTGTKYPAEMTITISKFVHDCLGIDDVDCSHLYHRGLKSIDSIYVMRVSNEFANKYPDRVYTGDVLIVKDAKGKEATYINPKYLMKIFENPEAREELTALSRIGVKSLKLLNDYMEKVQTLQEIAETNDKIMMFIRETHKEKKVQSYSKLKRREER